MGQPSGAVIRPAAEHAGKGRITCVAGYKHRISVFIDCFYVKRKVFCHVLMAREAESRGAAAGGRALA
jgi:hypothetical protein